MTENDKVADSPFREAPQKESSDQATRDAQPLAEDDSSGPVERRIVLNDEAVGIQSFRLQVKRRGEVVAHREAGAIPQQSDAAVGADGTIGSILRGAPAQGEEATLEACRALFWTLRRRGHRWHLPYLSPTQDDCDCVTQSLDEQDRKLLIQVVRAQADAAAWRELAVRGRHADANREPTSWAEDLRTTIEKKASRLAPQQRAALLLALDARTTAGYCLAPVISSFREGQRSWARSLGFFQIWLVGPSDEMTYRLDERDPADSA